MSDFPTTNESEIDEPTEETVNPDADRKLVDGVGFQDDEATELDQDSPDEDDGDEPNVDEPEKETD